ncbi:SMI1/KNR4 family protein [Eisenibacter elegans]|jgi:cell wall assembly regulator SMI1|uniref:SMI1/KNR4 family protein n=1 Tax=Eisenibacter elegans TaxID=997 RepID=UPI00040346ED|nr:SMI1/KNR4 family protein [Eisenibacter elegans]
MKSIWESIKSNLAKIAPELLKALHQGVTDTEVASLQALIKAELPRDFIDFYKIHNGQSDEAAGLIDCEELLSFERIADEWLVWKSLLDSKTFEDSQGPHISNPDRGIKNDWWNPLWIPITYDGSGNHYCLDLDPTEEGVYGQIIRMWHDDTERSLIAYSFKEWVTAYSQKLSSGELVYSEDYFGIISRDELGE